MGISVEPLLLSISDEAPCGADISFDSDLLELEQAFEGRPEQQMGDSVLEAEEPDWPDIRRRSLVLLERSRNLRVIVQLTVALMHTDGPEGLDAGLQLLENAVVSYWPTVHPELDADDDNDPTERINILASLVSSPGQTGDPVRFRSRFREMPLVRSPMFGAISMRDVQRADAGEAAAAGGPDAATIQAVAMDTDLEALVAARDHLVSARGRLAAIDQALTEHVGAASAVDFSDVLHEVDEATGIVRRWLTLRGHVDGGPAADAAGDPAVAAPDGAAGGSVAAAVAAAPPPPPPGSINGSGDVIAAIGRIMEYYRDNEPSSPVPLVLDAARSLVSRNFVEISSILTPDTVQVLQQIKGDSIGD